MKTTAITAAVIAAAVLVSCATAGGSGEGLSLAEAIERSAADLAAELPTESIVAVVGFSSEQQNLSLYIQDELTGALVEAGLTIADRRNLELLRDELKFQISGDVSDETAVSIGKFLGARYVITGQLVKAGNAYRYRLAGINVETAVQESSTRLSIRDDRNFRMLLAGVQSPQVISSLDQAGEEEYTVYYSGYLQGTVTIQRDRLGKITATSRVTGDGMEFIRHEICPLIPVWAYVTASRDPSTTIIDGNTFTTTYTDGRWLKKIVDGNTTTYTYSNGRWDKEVINGNTTTETNSDGKWHKKVVNGNTTTVTWSDGKWWKTVVNGNTATMTRFDGIWTKTVIDGNTETTTDSDGSWYKRVIDGNTETFTNSDGYWSKRVIDGNTKTSTDSTGRSWKVVVDKQGHDIFITLWDTVYL